MSIAAGVLGIAVAAVAVLGPSSRESGFTCGDVPPPRNAQRVLGDEFVSFTSDRDGRDWGYARSSNGGPLVRLPRSLFERMTRRVGDGEAPVWSADGNLVAHYDSPRRAIWIARADGSGKHTIAQKVDYPPQLAWSPTGQWIAFGRPLYDESGDFTPELVVVDRAGTSRLSPVSRVAEFAWSPGGTCLAYVQRPGSAPGSDEALWVANVRDGSTRKLIEAGHIPPGQGFYSPQWSRSGRFIAVAHVMPNAEAIEMADLREGRKHALPIRSRQLLGWSPTGDLLALESNVADAITVIRADGSTVWTTPLRESTNVDRLEWNPSGDGFAFQQGRGIYVAARTSPRARLISELRFSNVLSGWIARPGGAKKAASAPSTELASARMLRTRGQIEEISADGLRSAAVVASTRSDCTHVVVWDVDAERAARFEPVATCDDLREGNGENYRYGVRISGTGVTWNIFWCGSYCYIGQVKADARRPDETSSRPEAGYEVSSRPSRPLPPHEIRRGVELSVDPATIVLHRLSDRRTRSLSVPRGVVDAELENEGLFYAYNEPKAAMPGHVAFVPFGRLFG